jgi:hypothetical protein
MFHALLETILKLNVHLAKVKFDGLVRIMVEEEIKRWSRWLNGETFPWDAPNYPSENKILTRSLRM